ncbi:MAG TPA: hypothetical protein VGQ99_18825 [Tepidisphaeraceae bacterium]|jgi:hypothetical protein|nr:hypothetical protein [Tepidisphaeraceae bacterium]
MGKRFWIVGGGVLTLFVIGGVVLKVTHYSSVVGNVFEGKKTIAQRVAQYGPAARERWRPFFEKAGMSYPTRMSVTLVGLKEEKRLEVYAYDSDRKWVFIRSYPILAASGGPGPKLQRGDRQVPEGLYRIEALNPNSRFHLALRIIPVRSIARRRTWMGGMFWNWGATS